MDERLCFYALPEVRMPRTFRRRIAGRRKTFRGGAVTAANSGCTEAHRPLLGYHLHEDMKHDFGDLHILEGIYAPHGQLGGPGEDKVRAYFTGNAVPASLIPDKVERLGNKQIFTVQENTAVFGNDNTPVTLIRAGSLLGSRNNNVAIVQDAGKQLFDELGAANLLTFGSILDPALKPISKDTRPVYFQTDPKTIMDIPACEYGFNEAVLKTIRVSGFNDGVTNCYFQSDKWYDAIGMVAKYGGGKPKPINTVKIEEAGYFTSIANVNELETDPVASPLLKGADANRQKQFFYIGKALGDTLLVASLQNTVGVSGGALIQNPFLQGPLKRFAPDGYPIPAKLDYFVLNTGDRLNHTRAFIKGVPSIYQEKRKGEEKKTDAVKKFEYIPGALPEGGSFPGVEEFYKAKITTEIVPAVTTRYDDLIRALQAEAVDLKAFSRFTLTQTQLVDTLQKQDSAARVLRDVIQKLTILRNVVVRFYTELVGRGANFVEAGNPDKPKQTYRRATELFKLLTPQKTTFLLPGGLTNPALVVIRLPAKSDYIHDLGPVRFDESGYIVDLAGTFTVKLLRVMEAIAGGMQAADAMQAKDYRQFSEKFIPPAVPAASAAATGSQPPAGGMRGGNRDEPYRPALYEESAKHTLVASDALQDVDLKLFLAQSDLQIERTYDSLPLIKLYLQKWPQSTKEEEIKFVFQVAADIKKYLMNGAVCDIGLAKRFIEEAELLRQATTLSGRPSVYFNAIGTVPLSVGNNNQTTHTQGFNVFAECLNAQIARQFGYIGPEEVAIEENGELYAEFNQMCQTLYKIPADTAASNDGKGTPPSRSGSLVVNTQSETPGTGASQHTQLASWQRYTALTPSPARPAGTTLSISDSLSPSDGLSPARALFPQSGKERIAGILSGMGVPPNQIATIVGFYDTSIPGLPPGAGGAGGMAGLSPLETEILGVLLREGGYDMRTAAQAIGASRSLAGYSPRSKSPDWDGAAAPAGPSAKTAAQVLASNVGTAAETRAAIEESKRAYEQEQMARALRESAPGLPEERGKRSAENAGVGAQSGTTERAAKRARKNADSDSEGGARRGGGLTIIPDMLEGGSSRSRKRSYRRKLL